MPAEPDTRPTRQYPCPHCGGMGKVEEDRIEYWPITRPCGYCEGRGYFERPILPRGSLRAFAVLCDWYGWWGDKNAVTIIHATSAAKAKMEVAYSLGDVSGNPYRDILVALHARRAPEHDQGVTDGTD